MAGAAVYAAAGFLIAPLAIKLWIESPNVSGPNCRLGVQRVYVNPFTMFLSFKDVTLFEQENKLFVSATRAETALWTVEKFRARKRGRDVAIRNLSVTSTDSSETILAVPGVFARGVTAGVGNAFIDAAHARLERASATIYRDSAGIRHRPTWLSLPGEDKAGACISLDGFEALGGRLRMTDDAVTPSAQLDLRDVRVEARRKPVVGTRSTTIEFAGRIGSGGTLSVTAELRRPTAGHPDLFLMDARNVDLPPLSPYARRIFGRGIVSGSADVTIRQEQDGATLRIENQLDFGGLRLGEPDAERVDDSPPLELALALATDGADRSVFSIDSSVNNVQAQTILGAFTNSLTAHLDELAASPFDMLAGLAGDGDAVLDEIGFVPGSAEMAPESTNTLQLLADALRRRPRLGVRVRPGYDLTADRDAIAAQQVMLHIALATSASAREVNDSTSPDLDDPRVREILDEFAGARLSQAQRRAVKRDTGDATDRYRDVYLALVANERVSETVLRRLARFRSRSVIDALERDGIDRSRFRITDSLDTTANQEEAVSLKIELEVHPANDDDDA